MREVERIRVTNDELPALFRGADRSSLTAQQRYLCLIAADLAFLIIAAILGSFALDSSSGKTAIAIAGAIVLIISIILTLIIRIVRLEQDWYDGRAVAESVKSLAWRYMTCSEPYLHNLEPTEVDQKFTSDLSSLLAERKDFSSKLGGKLGTEPQITKRMREVRALDTEDRKTVYLSERMVQYESGVESKVNEQVVSGHDSFAGTCAHISNYPRALAMVSR